MVELVDPEFVEAARVGAGAGGVAGEAALEGV